MKYAVDRSLAGSRYGDEEIATSLDRVLKYWTLRNKFTGIHPDLTRTLRIKSVAVTMQGLQLPSSKQGMEVHSVIITTQDRL